MKKSDSKPLVVTAYACGGTREHPADPVSIGIPREVFAAHLAKPLRVQLGDDDNAPVHTLWLGRHSWSVPGEVWVSCIRLH